ncbi:polysaccharide deacetylase family protein [Cellulosimicrobium marinum]|uniref:polysaccharide deacetylase family protein n=1 Tax=Cellulosimicrobium marinum TaxID=1638992 RepID=UPI001E617BDD|nr:polysaccharide deacetylase family protein [Cellulosimicrobium marinum]MCB7136139.1 polysaccharide deacetylase family protein [Cellulosimicrobium marinum]
MTAPSDLVERLGHAPGTRAIILNADDYGMCRAANRAVGGLLLDGLLDSATLMVPCAWAPDALAFAVAHPHLDVGVHLVLTSEWSRYRWRPLTGVGTSLVDAAGYFPADVATVERQAAEDDVAAELAAQVDAALAAGLDVTHLDNHMGSVYGLETGRSFLPQVLALAARHGLPFRLPRTVEGMGLPATLQPVLDEAAAAADALGVVLPDRLWTHPFELAGEGTVGEEDYDEVKAGFLDLLRAVRPGVTEIYLHPMLDDDELVEVADHSTAKRGFEHRLLADPDVAAVLAAEGIVRVGWRDLRAVQRGGSVAVAAAG